ncbi:hypothetical protein ED733_007903 [Metarhizium rileyi]|uniref:O-methyltransferase, family 3 n=1 Tax=Metarhizium rileyi (strain RCEF 4871) TaxID=1649241 RepID=A0A5C6GLX2_METRR|nr:hypothetical protein ED733_007903 [Metarhizium rileyi]
MSPGAIAQQAVVASPRVHELLQKLHRLSEAQEASMSQIFFYLKRLFAFYLFRSEWSAAADDHMRDKFVSLEQDKCHMMYLLARSSGARNIVEAGTSFGVSTMYLALAVGQNVADARAASGHAVTGKVIATENEPTKAARARSHWKEAGDEIEPWIELREDNLLETLRVEEGMPDQIDMLLLDIWTPMALPTLEIIRPRLRKGAIVLADNTIMAKPLFKELLDYVHDTANGFKTTTMPYSGGLLMAVYLPE